MMFGRRRLQRENAELWQRLNEAFSQNAILRSAVMR